MPHLIKKRYRQPPKRGPVLLLLASVVLAGAILGIINYYPYLEKAAYRTRAADRNEPAVTRRIYAIHFTPLINGQKIWQHYGWNDPVYLLPSLINALNSVTNNRVNYTIAKVDEFPVFNQKADGFNYNEQSYQQCWSNRSYCHTPDTVDYPKILADYDICNKFNRGEFDELWLFGAPYFGYFESSLVGPNAFYLNSPPINNPSGCNKILPIMGYNYERPTSAEKDTSQDDRGLEGYGHRIEATMSKVYGGWEENRVSHNWDKFGLVKAQSPNFNYSGCGSVHYGPNSVAAYEWNNLNPVASNCDDFLNYPTLIGTTLSISCTAWGCSRFGYYQWWYRHIPSFDGVGPDGKYNNWWKYIADPNTIFQLVALPTTTPTPSPTLAPTNSPTPAPTSTPSPTAGPTAAPTPTPTTVPVTTRTPTPTRRPVPTKTPTPTLKRTPTPTSKLKPTPTVTPIPQAERVILSYKHDQYSGNNEPAADNRPLLVRWWSDFWNFVATTFNLL